MITALTGALAAAFGAALAIGVVAYRGHRRVEADEERAAVARDAAGDALAQLETDPVDQAGRDAERVVHGMTVPDLITLRAYESELGADGRLRRARVEFEQNRKP
ncbi:hypothetical protein [Salininema proteolyticum]|uniref:Uncharacterized protein n=1 Tax=Salininema proteolyticum TaxID=1607685 RepID=A0ABV8TU01_9ACTN